MIQALKDKKIWLRYIIPYTMGMAILIYLVAKSYIMQTTCDEAYTIHILPKQPVWDIITYKDSYTNNHILLTLLVKMLFALFGNNHSLSRLPSILAFVLYFYCCYQFAKQFISDDWVSMLFMAVMCCNPYLLDFFALTRGYGLSIGLMMTSIYFAARHILPLEKNSRDLPLSMGFAILAVYAQFATLHYYLGLSLLVFIYTIYDFIKNKNSIVLKKTLLTLLISALILGILIYLPLKSILKDNQIAYYGKDGFWENTITSLLHGSIYSQGYFSDNTFMVFKNLLIATFFITIAHIFYTLGQNKIAEKERIYPSVFACILFIATALSAILQFNILNNQYVVDRTALFYYPLLALLFPIISLFFKQFNNGVGIFVAVLLTVFSFNHIKRANHLSSYREWWYDVHTYEILDFFKAEYQKSDKKEPLKIHTSWIFHPSFLYHIDQKKLDFIAPLRYDSQPDTTRMYDFYYITRDDFPKLQTRYDTIKTWDWGQWILLKKKQ
jgi:hypothetical protein